MTAARRWRRCPSCQTVSAAGDLGTKWRSSDTPWSNGAMLRRCPHCGFRGQTRDFGVVRERGSWAVTS